MQLIHQNYTKEYCCMVLQNISKSLSLCVIKHIKLGIVNNFNHVLDTAMIPIKAPQGIFHKIQAVIGTASNVSIITQKCPNHLGLKLMNVPVTIAGIGESPVFNSQYRVNCALSSNNT